jgi:hypothetical protein
MEEIAPEYDVVVLGTGGLPLPRLRNTEANEANHLQVSPNACFQGNYKQSNKKQTGTRADLLAVFLVLRARRCSTLIAMTTMEGEWRWRTTLRGFTADIMQ